MPTNAPSETENPNGIWKAVAIAAPLGFVAWLFILYALSFFVHVPLFD